MLAKNLITKQSMIYDHSVGDIMNENVLKYCIVAIQKADKAKELKKMYVQVDAEVLKLLATELLALLQTERYGD